MKLTVSVGGRRTLLQEALLPLFLVNVCTVLYSTHMEIEASYSSFFFGVEIERERHAIRCCMREKEGKEEEGLGCEKRNSKSDAAERRKWRGRRGRKERGP